MRQKDPSLVRRGGLVTFCVKTIRRRRIADSIENKIVREAKSNVRIYFGISASLPGVAPHKVSAVILELRAVVIPTQEGSLPSEAFCLLPWLLVLPRLSSRPGGISHGATASHL